MPTPFRKPTPSTNGNGDTTTNRCPVNAKWPLPYWSSHDGRALVRLYHGHVIDVLQTLPARSVQCVVTSPPYWGLRDYGTGTWEGGNPNCDHLRPPAGGVKKSGLPSVRNAHNEDGYTTGKTQPNTFEYTGTCKKCGAIRTDNQLGSEPSPDCGTMGKANCNRCFVCNMVAVFRDVKRVLRDDGTCWLNLGDSYSGGGRNNGRPEGYTSKQDTNEGSMHDFPSYNGLPSGNLVGVPWRVALALQADGWVLRSDLPWIKVAPMPESVTNRPAKALEYVFMFTKGMDYYSDFESIRKRATPAERVVTGKSGSAGQAAGKGIKPSGNGVAGSVTRTGDTRNFWNADLWYESVSKPYGMVGVGGELVGINVASGSYSGSHFATFGTRLIEPLIKASTSEKGCCPQCGNPWKRLLKSKPSDRVDRASKTDTSFGPNPSQTHRPNGAEFAKQKAKNPDKTLGWHPTCLCGAKSKPVHVSYRLRDDVPDDILNELRQLGIQ